MIRKPILLCGILLVALAQCRKKDPYLKSNSHYLRCRVNDQEWIADVPDNPFGPAALQAVYTEETGDLTLMAVRKTQSQSVYEGITLAVSGIVGTGTYSMYTGNGTTNGFYDLVDNYPCGGYDHDPANPGMLHIHTIDTVQHIVKGTFYVVLKNPDCGPDSLLTITDGKFEFRY